MKNIKKRIIYVAVILTLLIITAFIFAHSSDDKPNVNSKKIIRSQVRDIQGNRSKPASAQNSTQESVAKKTVESTDGIKVTFLELGSVGCRPCVMMQPIMDEIENEYEGQVAVRFHDVNSLFGKPYAQKYNIRMIPTQVFLDKDGNEYYRHSGFFPKDEIIKILKLKGVE